MAQEMINVIFKRPVRFGNVVYPPSKRSQAVPAVYQSTRLMEYLMSEGEAIIVAPSAPKPAAPAAPAAPAKAK